MRNATSFDIGITVGVLASLVTDGIVSTVWLIFTGVMLFAQIVGQITEVKQPDKVRAIINDTAIAILDEIEIEARDLYLESDDENYQRAMKDIQKFIIKTRNEI